jgi:xanthine dehydrogenase YagS FAD-binding subunit
MRPFAFTRVDNDAAAIRAFAPKAQFLAGGTTLLDLMKLDVMRPETVIDINALSDRHAAIDFGGERLRLGALARMADAADHPRLRRDYPVVAQSLQLAASPQLRNMATLGGNILQRTRCSYFRDPTWAKCNKRDPGSGCAALEGVNRRHAVLGVSDQCIATYPGDFAQALLVLDADVEIINAAGKRTISFDSLHREPGDRPDVETSLKPGDLIIAFSAPSRAWMRRSLYLKIRDRQSFEFALTSAAVALDIQDGAIVQARIALGGVATKPWRAREAEAELIGKPALNAHFHSAAEAAFAAAQPREGNRFKTELGKRTLVRALSQVAEMRV